MSLSEVHGMSSEDARLQPYRIIDHESDIGFEVQAKTLEELFLNAARALFSVIAENSEPGLSAQRHFAISAEPDSLIVFLNELLYLWEIDRFIPASVKIDGRNDRLEIDLSGTILKNEDLVIGSVKAVTYHKFFVDAQEGSFKARFIADV